VREVDRAVDRIDEPAIAGALARLAAFFAEDRQLGGCKHVADQRLGARVPLRHEIGRSALRADLARPCVLEQEPRLQPGLACEIEQRVEIHHRSSRIATRSAPDAAENVSLAATDFDSVERSTTRKPNFAAKKSLAVAVSR